MRAATPSDPVCRSLWNFLAIAILCTLPVAVGCGDESLGEERAGDQDPDNEPSGRSETDHATIPEKALTNRVDFTISPTHGVAPLAVAFTDASRVAASCGFTKLRWDFGDGQVFDSTNPADKNTRHTYTRAATYTVIYKVTTRTCGTFTKTKLGWIAVSPAPTPTPAPTPIPTTTTTTTTVTPTTTTTTSPTTTTTRPTTTTTTSIPTTTSTTTTTRPDYALDFSIAPTHGVAPLVVRFADTGNIDALCGFMNFRWDFGDGETLAGADAALRNVTHTYTRSGTFTVIFEVTTASCGVFRQTKLGWIAVSGGQTTTTTTTTMPPTTTTRPSTTTTTIVSTTSTTTTTRPPQSLGDATPSFNFGLVHFHYYYELGGYNGPIFYDDHAWAADTVEFGLIYYGDPGMDAAWAELRANEPVGDWVKWRLAHLWLTNESAGTCADPRMGEADQDFANGQAEFDRFLAENPEHGDGESCFLHARYDGRIRARWHANGCDVTLTQAGLQGSAAGDPRVARIRSLVWDEYVWLFDVTSDCARDFISWRTMKDMTEDGYGGMGFDNLGSPLGDMYYLPARVDPIDIIEIADATETNAAALDEWWQAGVEGMVETVNARVQVTLPGNKVVFNGAAYCSWDGGVDRLRRVAGPNLGVWCEDAIQYPTWGWFDDADRMRTLIELSRDMAAAGGFVATEAFFSGGSAPPTAPEALFYLAAHYVMKHDRDVYATKPDWSPYRPLAENWFAVYGRDIGAPIEESTELQSGIFSRRYVRADGQATRVLVRADADAAPVNFTLDADYCRVNADDTLTPTSGTIAVPSGAGLILIRRGTGGGNC